jgi:hypothetical protein
MQIFCIYVLMHRKVNRDAELMGDSIKTKINTKILHSPRSQSRDRFFFWVLKNKSEKHFSFFIFYQKKIIGPWIEIRAKAQICKITVIGDLPSLGY